ncbi:MAG: TetR/AcrR family transcriptional regulator [Ignavibacteriales bacterium]|nr:TetR/AcrR family transcriptional regulator [Ignavibacteriales bacterium]
MINDTVIRDRILRTATEQFYSHGFSKVTVDEIASKIGISKKTIYKFYSSKEDLIRAVTDTVIAETETGFRDIVEDIHLDFVEKLRKMMTFVGIHLSRLSKYLIEDLERNTPHVWSKISEYRTKNIYQHFGSLIREGRKKGIFRNDIDEQLVLMIYANAIENIINPNILSQLPVTANQVYETIIKVIFEGLLTDEARTRYLPKELLRNNNRQQDEE